MTERCEIAVVGAGPVGLLAAVASARAGRRTMLVGTLPQTRDGRTAAVLAPAVALLDEMGLWNSLRSHAAPLRGLRIVDDTGSLFRPPPVTFEPSEIGLDAFGWNIENARLSSLLAGAARDEPLIIWIDAFAEGFAAGDPARLALADGTVVEADLVVAADGRRSVVRQAAGISVRETRHRQVALTTIMRHERSHGFVSTEFHKRGGPLTLVPMPLPQAGRTSSSLVWVVSPGQARRLKALADEAFAAAVADACGRLLGDMALAGPRGAVPLASVMAARFANERLILAGEAAHVLPPIGAQGLNLGFSDVAALRRLLVERRDPGDRALLARYDRDRRADAGLRGAAVDSLNRSLLSSSPMLDAVRGIGLDLVGRLRPLRRAMMMAGLPRSAAQVRSDRDVG